jgi:hypothetical protein
VDTTNELLTGTAFEKQRLKTSVVDISGLTATAINTEGDPDGTPAFTDAWFSYSFTPSFDATKIVSICLEVDYVYPAVGGPVSLPTWTVHRRFEAGLQVVRRATGYGVPFCFTWFYNFDTNKIELSLPVAWAQNDSATRNYFIEFNQAAKPDDGDTTTFVNGVSVITHYL